MSWRQERKKEREQKAAAEAARQAKEKALKELSIHPLLNERCSRDFCDAYFHGLVIAAFADNKKLDKGERVVLDVIGASLEMSTHDVDDVVNTIQTAIDDDDTFESLLNECMSVIKVNESAVKLFYAQVVQVWFSSAGEGGDSPDDDLYDIVEKTDVALPTAKLSLIKKVLKGDDELDANLLSLSEWMGEDALKYFVVKTHGDVTDRLVKARKHLKDKEANRKKAIARARKHAQDQIATIMKDVGEVYQEKASVYKEALDDISERVNGIDGEMIDWVVLVNDILKPVRIDEFDYVAREKRCLKCRVKIWRLVTLLMVDYKPRLSAMTNELGRLLSRDAIDRDSWQQNLEKFIAQYLADRVTLS